MTSAPAKAHDRRQIGDFLLTWLPRTLVGLALVFFIYYFFVYVQYAAALFQFPFDYDQGEGYELVDTLLFSQGQWPYRDPAAYPFYSSNYPPVFHLVIVPLVWLFGPQYWTGRLVSFAGTLITAAAIGFAVQHQSRRLWLALLAGLAFLASNYVYHVGPLFRQHMFMVMFETLAIVLLAITLEREEADGRPHSGRIVLVLLLLLLAGYTKQLAYATVAAAFIFLALRTPRRAVLLAIGFGAVTAAVFWAIDLATGGMWLLNTVTANLNPFIAEQAIGLFRQWLQLHPVLVGAAAALAVYQLYFSRLSAYAVWFVLATANSVTAGKWGAGESYFATAIAAGAILLGLAAHKLLTWAEGRSRVWQGTTMTLLAILMLWQGAAMFHMPTGHPLQATIARALGRPTQMAIAPQTSCSAARPPEPIYYVDAVGPTLLGRPPDANDTLAGQRIAAFLAAGSTAPLSEEAGFSLYAGHDVVTNPTQMLNLYNNNALDLSRLLAMLEQQAFPAVVLRAQFYPPPVLEQIGQKYETVELVQMNGFVYCLMRPRPS